MLLYGHDKQLLMINMKLPGAEAHVFAYDSEGRQAFSRDGNQYGRGRRAFAFYDALGRVAVTGTCQDVADEEWWSQPSSSRPAMTARRSGAASAVNRWGVACGYDWDVELTNIEILTVSYYDDYGFATDNSAMITLPQGAKASPKGLATGTLTAMLGNGGGSAISEDGISGYLLSTNFYDTEERLIETRTRTPGGGLLTATIAYTAGGVPVQTRTQLAQGDTQLTYTNDITVDRHGRPVTSVLTRGDSGPSWALATCTYDGIGRLSSVTAGGTLTRNVSYDIHGWQTGWETPYLSEILYYGEGGPSGTTPSYIGLITAKKMYTAGGRLKSPDTYSYSYDRLGRLTAAKYSAANVLINFSTTYAYDLQGNMLRMTRMGLTAPGRYGEVDNVTATYTGNQLHTLRDDAPEVLLEASMDVSSGLYPSGSFAYDANGNMTSDMSRDITDMEYNALNLPCRATFADGSRIDWLYTASGEKLRQTVIAATGDTLSRRDYLGPYLFVDNEFDRYETAEGYITPDNAFHAYIPDYQGNIVGVYNTSPNAITSIASPLEQHTRYYPYGLPFADASNPTANRRKYGAKELTPDLGLNAYDFEARTLTPALCRWTIQDPEQEQYYDISSYAFCHNNPVMYVDPSGKTDFLVQETEEHIYVNDNVNQVIEISGSNYQTLVSQGFDSTTEEYSNIVANGIQRTDLLPTVNAVIDAKKYVPYGRYGDCFKSAVAQNNSATTGPMNRIDLYNEDENTFNYTEGVDYIKSQLLEGKSVITGVSYKGKSGNHNSSTNHFINIVGMGFEIGQNGPENYSIYYDNAPSDSMKGTDITTNKFHEGQVVINNKNISVLHDEPSMFVPRKSMYIVTEVRKNIKSK